MDYDENEENRFGFIKNIIGILIFIGVVIFVWNLFDDSSSTLSAEDSSDYTSEYSSDYEDESLELSYDEAIDEYWDEISENVDGYEDVEACADSGCYTLEAYISSGYINEINFSNGGNLDFYAEIDEDGMAYDTDEDGNSWDFTVDMNGNLVSDAVEDWADDNGYTVY